MSYVMIVLQLCDESIYGSGVYQFGLAVSFAVDEINRRADILPNVTLGYAVLDDCGYTIPSAARSIQFTPILADGESIQMAHIHKIL